MQRTIVLLSILILTVVGCSEPQINYPSRQMPAGLEQDRAGLAWAAETFLAKCAYCHGRENEGRGSRADFFNPPAPDFHEDIYRTVDPAYLFWRITEGKTVEPFLSRGSVMPAWGMHFSERQTWLLVIYLRQRASRT